MPGGHGSQGGAGERQGPTGVSERLRCERGREGQPGGEETGGGAGLCQSGQDDGPRNWCSSSTHWGSQNSQSPCQPPLSQSLLFWLGPQEHLGNMEALWVRKQRGSASGLGDQAAVLCGLGRDARPLWPQHDPEALGKSHRVGPHTMLGTLSLLQQVEVGHRVEGGR